MAFAQENEDWKAEFNGKIMTKRQICDSLDRAFRCGIATSGSPLEFYGPIPRVLRKEEYL